MKAWQWSIILFLFLPVLSIAQTGDHKLVLASPDNKLQLNINEAPDGKIYYNFKADKVQLIDQSEMGLDTSIKTIWKNVSTRSVNTTWEPLWGKRKLVQDAYNEAVIDLSIYSIRIRSYNNGIAFRYEGSNQERN
jgi:alpha-glucosidase